MGVLFLNTACHRWKSCGFYPVTDVDPRVTVLVLGVPSCDGLTEAKKPVLPRFHAPEEARTLPAAGAAGMPGDIPTEAEGHAEPPGPSESLTGNPCAPFQGGCLQTRSACICRHEHTFTGHLYGPGTVLGVSLHLDVSPLSSALTIPSFCNLNNDLTVVTLLGKKTRSGYLTKSRSPSPTPSRPSLLLNNLFHVQLCLTFVKAV